MLPDISVDSVFLFTAWGVLSSLLASYIPGFREWFASETPTFKRVFMFLGILIIAVICVILSLTHIWMLIPMTKEGILLLIVNIFLSISANQGAYNITPTASSVQALKESSELARLVALSSSTTKEG